MLPASTKKAAVLSIATSTVLIKHVQAVTGAPLPAAKPAAAPNAVVVAEAAAGAVVVEGAVEGANQFYKKFGNISITPCIEYIL